MAGILQMFMEYLSALTKKLWSYVSVFSTIISLILIFIFPQLKLPLILLLGIVYLSLLYAGFQVYMEKPVSIPSPKINPLRSIMEKFTHSFTQNKFKWEINKEAVQAESEEDFETESYFVSGKEILDNMTNDVINFKTEITGKINEDYVRKIDEILSQLTHLRNTQHYFGMSTIELLVIPGEKIFEELEDVIGSIECYDSRGKYYTSKEAAENFLSNRYSHIETESIQIGLKKGPKVILHIVSLDAFNQSLKLDLHKLDSHSQDLPPIDAEQWGHKYGLDSFLTISKDFNSSPYSYVQVFRNSCIEAVNSSIIYYVDESCFIPSIKLENDIINIIPKYLSFQKNLEINPPFLIKLSLLEVEDCTLSFPNIIKSKDHLINNRYLPMKAVVVKNYNENPADYMKPIFDSIANAAGYPRSFNYNEKGKRIR